MNKRLIVFFFSFCIFSMILFFRLGSLSVDSSLLQVANSQSKYTLSFNKTRGQIYDKNLNRLTDTGEEYFAACLPSPDNIHAILNEKALSTRSSLEDLVKKGRPFLARCNSDTLDINNVEVLTVPVRQGKTQLAPHMVGYTQGGVGVTGIEKAYDELLNEGTEDSTITYTVNGFRMPLLGEKPEINSAKDLKRGVVLTLDSNIQQLCEEIGEKHIKKGAVAVLAPQTGKILGAASFPSYQPNNLAKAIEDVENAPLINRAFSNYNVGSTFKIVTAATALSQGISKDLAINCTGVIDVYGQKFSCHKKSGHGQISLKEAIEVSCNPYFIQLGQLLDKQRFYNMALDLSFSKKAQLAPNFYTSGGYLPTPSELNIPAAVGNFSFGQGDLMATPIQVAQMVSAVINGGKTPFPQLVEGFTLDGKMVDYINEVTPPIVAFDSDIARLLKDYLITSVMETQSQNAKPKYVSAGGKTGTAQTGQIKEDGEEMLLGWFVGFFPSDNPQYVVSVVVEDATNGNADASPVFAEIADALYKPIKYKEK